MQLFSHQCTQCHKRWAKTQCILDNDEMAPFGSELLCPSCKAITMTRMHPLLIAVLVIAGVGLGAAMAYVLG
jgi:hypothetical protein